ncbi:thioesterase family protein [Grosmannia clavigera kw1407]|uniref:Thioesterase family protein n=1 Tax=Grosmannia clavigera (strain kw1407 / UAMH 11150) TaxID=655863 RepID=F0XBM6_GROCL|nr:thioesterase family protein [Grosmannia clavigera kw1407]EFX04941.1 thioesterase family protein [Grosmannia clavigera kw1407]
MTSDPNFDEATRITRLDATTYGANFPARYCIGSVPHGGFIASCFLRVVQTHLAGRGQPDTVIAHVEYVSRTEIGPAVFVVDEVKLGQRTSVVHVSLFQHALATQAPWITPGQSRREAVAYLTNSALDRETGLSLPTGYVLQPAALPPPPPPADFARLGRDGVDDHWQRRPIPPGSYRAVMAQTEFYVPKWQLQQPESPPKHHPSPQQRSIVDMWIRLATGERFTNTLLGFVADVWPYVVESYRPQSDDDPDDAYFDPSQIFWYPTLALNLDVKKALPPDGVEWLFVRIASKQIRNGRLDLEVVILDDHHDLVALSHHVSLILDASRNLSERSHTKSSM